jgi:hypothetical protein
LKISQEDILQGVRVILIGYPEKISHAGYPNRISYRISC